MDSQTFISNAIKTESVPSDIVVSQVALHAALSLAIEASNVLDLFKKKIYYGKAFDQEKLTAALESVSVIAGIMFDGAENDIDRTFNNVTAQEDLDKFDFNDEGVMKNMRLSNLNVRLLHGALGKFTEAGEMLEALKKQYETGALDVVNFKEEVGDDDWYKAIILDELQADEGDIRDLVINKLKARYPGKFDADAANHRDLAAERAVLEGGAQ